MRRLSGLLCIVLIALSPVRASAIDRQKWERFVMNHGCEAAVTMAAKWIDEAVEIIGLIGKQRGCEWVTDKFLGPSPEQKSKLAELSKKFSTLGVGFVGDECRKDLDCFNGTTLLNCKDLDDCGTILHCEFSKTDPKKGTCARRPHVSFNGLSLPNFRKSCMTRANFVAHDRQCGDGYECRPAIFGNQQLPVSKDSELVFGECVPSVALPRQDGPDMSSSSLPSQNGQNEWMRKFAIPLQNGRDMP
jgi:hypothetical protein